MQKTKSFARFVCLPENRAALGAAQALAACLLSNRPFAGPLVLHGTPGTGKSHLALALAREVTRRAGDIVVNLLAAADFDLLHEAPPSGSAAGDDLLENARQSDLLIIEDLQHLSARAVEALVQLLDHRLARERPTLITSRSAPQQLSGIFPARLTSRLSAGLVVGLEPLQATSRRSLLQEFAQRRQLAVPPEVLAWLADHVRGTGRILEAVIRQLEALARQSNQPLDLPYVLRHFHEQVEAGQPTIELIVQRVGDEFRVEPRALQSRRRYHSAMRPRQVGMYLARRLTPLSLEQIGAYFGGRDHTTVLHACRKIEDALTQDEWLSHVVRQLQADLS